MEWKMRGLCASFIESVLMPDVIDLVCGMTIDRDTARARSQYEGRTFYFCSDACKRQFDAAPER